VQSSVAAAFWSFTQPLEGHVDQMYCDVLGLVTTGVGNLIDPLPLALGLPWLHRGTDEAAPPDMIAAEWHAVKDGHVPAFHGQRPLYLTADAIEALVLSKLQRNEAYLARRWANWADWPADAQLAAHSIAWAAGPAWHAPHFDAAVAELDFDTCAGPAGDANEDPACRGEAWLRDTGNAGLRPRNLANKLLLQNAARVVSQGLPRDVLHWPAVVDPPCAASTPYSPPSS
jgi:hypothetical protein